MDYPFYGKAEAFNGVVTLEIELPLENDRILIINGNGHVVPVIRPLGTLGTATFEVQNSHFILIGWSIEFTGAVIGQFTVEGDIISTAEDNVYLGGVKVE